jgi:hypothetical protein
MQKGESLCYADTVCRVLQDRFTECDTKVPIIWMYDIACNHMSHLRVLLIVALLYLLIHFFKYY